jgi:hypothetical protein
MLGELTLLNKHVQHIKDIVAMQQSYAKLSGVVGDSSRGGPGRRRRSRSTRAASTATPSISCAITPRCRRSRSTSTSCCKSSFNLLRKRQACPAGQRLRRSTHRPLDHPQHGYGVRITIKDNGIGIAPENLTRIFSHGFDHQEAGARLRPAQRRPCRQGKWAASLSAQQRRSRDRRGLYPGIAHGGGSSRSPRKAPAEEG